MLKIKAFLAALKIFNLFVLTAAVGGTTLLTACSLFDKHSFWCNLCAQFKWQYLWVQLISVAFLLLYRYWKTVALVVTAAILNLVPIALLYVPENLKLAAQDPASQHTLTLLQLNAYFRNSSYENILRYCKKVNPDVILIEELTPGLAAFLERELGDYTYRKIQPQTDPFGIGVFSKVRIAGGQVMDFGNVGLPSIVCSLDLDDKQITLIGTHTMTPTTIWGLRQQNEELGAISKFCHEIHGSTIIAGDLNTTSFTSRFSGLLSENNLYDTRKGFGMECSWPSASVCRTGEERENSSLSGKRNVDTPQETRGPSLVDRLFMIPIDHCLASKDLITLKHSVGQPVGSDHFPVYTEFTWSNGQFLKSQEVPGCTTCDAQSLIRSNID